MEKKPKTIFIDCTATFNAGHNTGIQRVVRQIIHNSTTLSRTSGIPCIPIVFAFGQVWSIDTLPISNPDDLSQISDRFAKRFKLQMISAFKSIESLLPEGKLKYIFKKIAGKILGAARSLWLTTILFISFLSLMFKTSHRVTISNEDMIIAVDAFWTFDIVKYLEKYKKRGVFIVMLIYDLIPVTHPDFIDDLDNNMSFTSNLKRMLLLSDGFIAISKSVKDEVIDYINDNTIFTDKRITADYFYLGADIKDTKSTNGQMEKLRIWPKELWTDDVYLMVGTIEPRKGHTFVLDAFEKMWSQGSNDKLFIVGRIGWKCTELMERIKKSPFIGDKLFMFHDINDSELIYCYEHATALIFASYVEGFGLPLVEAMGKGLPVISSDIQVFKEIGKDYPVYFSHNSIDTLIEALSKVTEKSSDKRGWITWDESVNTLLNKALDMYARSAKGLDNSV
ncbi:MAG: glycosyltransferase family 4 protein [Deltaproteobacteria bacterium]|nr:glycosyltransferase family 4 protein [Deltaproteobacteria bacterium]